jgi:RNA polymerase sigma-70 factor (ECF subfamily)
MTQDMDWLARQFEACRGHLRGLAYRMLGSYAEADDAVQEAWLRLTRSDTPGIDNLGGWLTTVVARISLDVLRARKSRDEIPFDGVAEEAALNVADTRATPEQNAMLADSLGVALLVVLDTLAPAERLAFVLHDMFDLPFDEIGGIIGRTPEAARQLASRARRRVQGNRAGAAPEMRSRRRVVDAFIAAFQAGDVEGLLAVLDPELEVCVDAYAARSGQPSIVRGAQNWARGAVTYSKFARHAYPVLIDGAVGIVMGADAKHFRLLRFEFTGERIARIEVIADPASLGKLGLSLAPDADA